MLGDSSAQESPLLTARAYQAPQLARFQLMSKETGSFQHVPDWTAEA